MKGVEDNKSYAFITSYMLGVDRFILERNYPVDYVYSDALVKLEQNAPVKTIRYLVKVRNVLFCTYSKYRNKDELFKKVVIALSDEIAYLKANDIDIVKRFHENSSIVNTLNYLTKKLNPLVTSVLDEFNFPYPLDIRTLFYPKTGLSEKWLNKISDYLVSNQNRIPQNVVLIRGSKAVLIGSTILENDRTLLEGLFSVLDKSKEDINLEYEPFNWVKAHTEEVKEDELNSANDTDTVNTDKPQSKNGLKNKNRRERRREARLKEKKLLRAMKTGIDIEDIAKEISKDLGKDLDIKDVTKEISKASDKDLDNNLAKVVNKDAGKENKKLNNPVTIKPNKKPKASGNSTFYVDCDNTNLSKFLSLLAETLEPSTTKHKIKLFIDNKSSLAWRYVSDSISGDYDVEVVNVDRIKSTKSVVDIVIASHLTRDYVVNGEEFNPCIVSSDSDFYGLLSSGVKASIYYELNCVNKEYVNYLDESEIANFDLCEIVDDTNMNKYKMQVLAHFSLAKLKELPLADWSYKKLAEGLSTWHKRSTDFNMQLVTNDFEAVAKEVLATVSVQREDGAITLAYKGVVERVEIPVN